MMIFEIFVVVILYFFNFLININIIN